MPEPTITDDPFADDPIPSGIDFSKLSTGVNSKGKQMTTAAVKRSEKGTYTQTAVANPVADPPEYNEGLEALVLPTFDTTDTLQGIYSRVEDIAETPGFFKLEDMQGVDMLIVSIHPSLSGQYRNPNGKPSEYAVVEFYFANKSDIPDGEEGEGPFFTTVGGTVALPKLKSAAKKIVEGKASGPLVAAFEQKYTNSGQMFWDVR